MKFNVLVMLGAASIISSIPACAVGADLTPVSFDKVSSANIRKIALLRVSEPNRVSVVNIGGAGLMFGLLGGAAEGSKNSSMSKTFVTAINDRRVRVGLEMAKAVQDELRQLGYDVAYLESQFPKMSPDKKTDDYSHIETDADAILNVWFSNTGYASQMFSADYLPWLNVSSRLIEVKSRRVLYFQVFSAGLDKTKLATHEYFTVDQQYKYGSFDDLMAKVDQAIEGILVGHRQVAKLIAAKLAPDSNAMASGGKSGATLDDLKDILPQK